MKKLVLILLLLPVLAFAQKKKTIIVLTYDDAIPSQLDIAIPQLDSAGLKGTFFLIGNNINQDNMARWKAASLKGHELANHTIYHPCLITTVKGNPANNSGAYTVYMMLREIRMMNTLLYAIDGQTSHTYAYPCTEPAVGGVNYVDSLRQSGTTKYARMGGNQDAIVTDYSKLDPLWVPSCVAAGLSGNDMIAYVKKVQAAGGMGVLMFHGVGGDYLITTAQAHRELLKYLKDHQSEVTVMTFKQAMDYVTAKK